MSITQAHAARSPNGSGNQECPQRSKLLKAAQDYAAQGWPVVQCEPGGKKPLIKDWPNRATTDPRTIEERWRRCPDANIGILTGKRSGIWALDVDNPASLDALEAEHGKLPATRTHATGSGGIHYLYRYPLGEHIGNSAGRLGDGLDVRGEGGYIIVPPSRTTRQYELLDDLPLSDPPARLLEALKELHKRRNRGKRATPTGDITTALDGPPIPEGTRNSTLASIAGKLNDGSRTLEALTADLLEINAARCAPPLPDGEVEGIARSVHRLAPCKTSTPEPSAETLEALDAIEARILAREWPGMGGKSERDVCIALAGKMRECGRMIPAGVRVSIGYGELAVLAGLSKRALLDYRKNGKRKLGIISRLKNKGILRTDSAGRSATEAGAFVLLFAVSTRFHHSPSAGHLKNPENTCGETLTTLPRLRWGYPGIRRLGKTRGAVLDVLEAAGGELELAELERRLYPERPADRRRLSYLRRRILPPLVRAAVVECISDTVRLASGYLEALERRREAGGEIAAETRDRERNKRRSLERRERLAGRDTRILPSAKEIAAVEELREIAASNGARRSFRAQRAAMRDPRSLERITNLVGAIGRRVRTPHGVGELWDHKGGEARVILDVSRDKWTPIDVGNIELLGEAV